MRKWLREADIKCRMQNAECKMQNAECRMQNAELNAECKMSAGGGFSADSV